MKKFEVSQKIEVFLNEEQQKNITLDFIFNKFNWRENYNIKNGKVVVIKTYHGSHSWSQEEVVRDALEIDYFVAGLIKRIKFL